MTTTWLSREHPKAAPYDEQNLFSIEIYKLTLDTIGSLAIFLDIFSYFILSKFTIYKIINSFRNNFYIELVLLAILEKKRKNLKLWLIKKKI